MLLICFKLEDVRSQVETALEAYVAAQYQEGTAAAAVYGVPAADDVPNGPRPALSYALLQLLRSRSVRQSRLFENVPPVSVRCNHAVRRATPARPLRLR